MTPLRLLICTLGLVASVLVAAAQQRVELPSPGYDLAVHPMSGAVAIVHPNESTVTLYPNLSAGSTQGAISRKVARGPLDVICKQVGANAFLYAVICHDGNRMFLFDDRFEPLREIALTVNEPSSVFTSRNPQDPFIYYCGGRGHESSLAAVDVTTFRDVGKLPAPGHGSMMDGDISADGAIVYGRGPWSPSGHAASRVQIPAGGGAPKLAPLHYEHNSVAPFLADPLGNYVANGDRLFTRDLKREAAKLPDSAVLFLEHRPLIIAQRGGKAVGRQTTSELTAISYNTLQTVGAPVPLGAAQQGEGPVAVSPANTQADFKRLAFTRRFAASAKQDVVLCLDRGTVQIIPVSAFAAPAEPLLHAAINVPPSVSVGEAIDLRVSLAAGPISVRLEQAPAGMTLSGGKLQWTPPADAIGTHTVKLALSSGAVQRTQEFTLNVRRNAIDLPFEPNLHDVTADASAAVIGRSPQDGSGGDSSTVAVLDLRTLKVAVQRELATAISCVAIDERYVYAGLRNSDAFFMLNRHDLSDAKRVFTEGLVQGIAAVTGTHVAITTERGSLVYNPQSGEMSELAARSPFQQARGNAARSITPAADGWLLGGVVYDQNLTKVRAVLAPEGLASVGDVRPPRPEEMSSPQYSTWSSYIQQDMLRRTGGQQVAQLSSAPGRGPVHSSILPSRPAVAILSISTRNQGQQFTARGEIVLRDLITGTPQSTLPLFDEFTDQQQAERAMHFSAYSTRLIATSRHLVAFWLNRAFVVEIPKLPDIEFPAPLHFLPDQSVTLVTAGQNARQPVRVGGAQKVELTLKREMRGIDMNKSTGEISIDGDVVIKAAAEQLAKANTGPMQLPGGKGLSAYLPAARTRFKQLTGKDAQGIPAFLPLEITARDASMQSATITLAVLLDVPTALVPEQPAEATAPVSAPPRWATTNPAARPEPRNALTPEQRIEQMERRIENLENRLDAIFKLLGERR